MKRNLERVKEEQGIGLVELNERTRDENGPGRFERRAE